MFQNIVRKTAYLFARFFYWILHDFRKLFCDYLLLTEDKLMTKMDHYLDVYHLLLAPWRSQDISFLEIGVWRVAP